VIGGPFIHIVQIAAASVAALALFARLPSLQARRALGGALVLLAVPWVQFVDLGELFPMLAASVAGVLAWYVFEQRPVAALAAAAFALLVLEGLDSAILSAPHPPAPVAPYDPHALAEASWGSYVKLISTHGTLPYELAKLPTVIALCALAATALFAAFGSRIRPRTES